MVFQFSVHRFKMIYWSGPKKDEYTEELRPPPSDNEQNRKNVAVGSGIFFLQKAMAKAGTLKNNDKDSERNVILVVLEKCSKRMSRSYRGVSHKWIKDGFFAVADWSRHQKNTTLVTVKVFLVSKGFWLLLFCFFFFLVCFFISLYSEQMKMWHGKRPINFNHGHFHVCSDQKQWYCFSAPYLPSHFWWLMDTDLNTLVFHIISFQLLCIERIALKHLY